MRIHRTGQREPSGIRNAGDTGFTIIVFHIVQKPVDRIPGIRTLINGVFLILTYQRLVNFKSALAFESPSYILENKNISILHHVIIWKFIRQRNNLVSSRVISIDTIGRPVDKERICGLLVYRSEYNGIQ